MSLLKNVIWAFTLIVVVVLICGTLLWINAHSWTLRFEMDDNTLEAVKSIDWPTLRNCTGVRCS